MACHEQAGLYCLQPDIVKFNVASGYYRDVHNRIYAKQEGDSMLRLFEIAEQVYIRTI